MVLQVWILGGLLSAVCGTSLYNESINWSISDETVSELQHYCPSTAFCNTDPKGGTLNQDCCKPCSCEPDCVITGTCCVRYNDGRYMPNVSECISTHKAGKRISNVFYKMITICDERHNGRSCTMENNGSGSALESEQLSLYPVTSPITRMTYVNPNCARCNSEISNVPWRVTVICPTKIHNLTAIQVGLRNGDCESLFIPPEEHNAGFFQEKCEPGMIGSCNTTGLWDVFDENIASACELVNTPYEHSYVTDATKTVLNFANPFCFRCNIGNNVARTEMCDTSGRGDTLATTPLNIILDWNKLWDDVGDHDDPIESESVCGNSHIRHPSFPNKCFQLLCPENMVRRNGKCAPIFDLNLVFSIGIFLKFTPVTKHGLPEEDIRQLNKSICQKFLSKLPVVKRVFYCAGYFKNESGVIHYIGVTFSSYELNSHRYLEIYESITLAMKKPCSIRIGANEMLMDVDFLDMPIRCDPTPDSNICFESLIAADFKNNRTAISHYESSSLYAYERIFIFRSSALHIKQINYISPLSTCEQIELPSSMYVYEKYRIYLNHTDMYLYRYQFSVTNTNTGQEPKVRICVEDFVDKEEDNNFIKNDHDISADYLTMGCLLVSIACIVISITSLLRKRHACQGELPYLIIVPINLLFAQLLYFSSLIVGQSSRTACTVLGALTHFMWLATVLSLLVNSSAPVAFRLIQKHRATIIQASSYIIAFLLTGATRILHVYFGRNTFGCVENNSGWPCFTCDSLTGFLIFLVPIEISALGCIVAALFSLTKAGYYAVNNIRIYCTSLHAHLALSVFICLAWLCLFAARYIAVSIYVFSPLMLSQGVVILGFHLYRFSSVS